MTFFFLLKFSSIAKKKCLCYDVQAVVRKTRRGVRNLSEVRVNEGENIENALKRFKKKIQKAGILSEIKRRERYEKPSVKRKRKSEAARKRRS